MTEEISADLALADSEARESRERVAVDDVMRIAARSAVCPAHERRAARDALRTAVEALARAALAPAVPPGFVLVPVIPTVEIVCAIEDTVQAQLDASAIHAIVHRLDGEVIWDLALAAAPSAKEPTCPKN